MCEKSSLSLEGLKPTTIDTNTLETAVYGHALHLDSDRLRLPSSNPFTPENPFLGTKLLVFNVERGSGDLKGLIEYRRPIQAAAATRYHISGLPSAGG